VREVVDDISKQNKDSQEFIEDLMAALSGYQIRTSPLYPNFALHDIFKDAVDHRIIKTNNRKQVIFLKTDSGNFFIKRSFLSRKKDRFRHLILPRRRWAEWRNLHKLSALGLDAAQPVLCGQNLNQEPNSFFILTKGVEGNTLSREKEIDPVRLGGFFAKLHQKGFYYADLHPGNFIIKPDGQPVLIDAQEIFSLKKLPRRLRSYNLGRLYLALKSRMPDSWFEEFLRTYNHKFKKTVHIHDIREAATKHYKKHIKSRTKRCLKNSSEFEVIKTKNQKIYKRKDFTWDKADILNALKNGIDLKENKVFAYNSVCIKIHSKGRFHKDRCLASWKNSRALDMHGINIPRALGYFKFDQKSYFLADYLNDGIPLYKFLPTLAGGKHKRKIIKQLALWVRNIHQHQIWQKDFNATNVLYSNNQLVLLDLDNVKFGELSETQKIHNLAQLNASAADEIRLKDRIRFFYYYFDGQWPDRDKRRQIYQTIWEITLTKNTAVFGLDNSDPNSFNIPE
jgi:tRNA A-37 threonylcarbamoyl transferase component Bud32